jgi:NADPH:quinone reductase-like Zn-dependent oxidoreductase
MTNRKIKEILDQNSCEYDKVALQEVVFITNHYVNNTDWWRRDREEYIEKLIKFLEENVIHCSMDNDYK